MSLEMGCSRDANTDTRAADATTHLFFAYLRSLSPEHEMTGITMLPRSLQKLLNETEYPPSATDMLFSRTNRLVMIVDTVSPTPFALLRRASKFEYRDTDVALRKLSDFEDATEALTEECRRVLKAISAANQSQASSAKHSTSLRDASWSRFEDMGFASALTEEDDYEESAVPVKRNTKPFSPSRSMLNVPNSAALDSRPMTPSWADFLSTGFVDESGKTSTLVPPDQVLPPIDIQQRQYSSQSHQPRLESNVNLEPGELASITPFNLDDAFWWVWMSSLAPEETSERKAAFGRCAVIETTVHEGSWLVMEEIIAGAAPDPEEGAYIAERKGFFSWTKRSRTISRRKSVNKYTLKRGDQAPGGGSTTSIGPDTQAKIAAKAAQLRAIQEAGNQPAVTRRGRTDEEVLGDKTNSVFNPNIAGEATAAMKWAKKYDKGTIKDAYMSNSNAGRGVSISPAPTEQPVGDTPTNGSVRSPIGSAANGSIASANGSAKALERKAVPVALKEILTPVVATAIPKKETPKVVEAKVEEPKPKAIAPKKTEEVKAPKPVVQETKEALPESEVETVPPPPPKDDLPVVTPVSSTPAPVAAAKSPETPHKPAVLEKGKEKGGLRKLFLRKNRSSKIPENASAQLNTLLQQDAAAKTDTAPASTEAATVHVDGQETVDSTIAEPTLEADSLTSATQVPAGDAGKTTAAEEASAKEAFSRFDQGPLTDQPAFAPEDTEDDDAAPPPIGRRKFETMEKDTEGLTRTASPGVQDRWAQIRKNAANRAAQRQGDERDRSMGTTTKTGGDGDDDTSGEESKY